MAPRAPSAIVCDMKLREFENDEYYHIYNRGTDGRKIFDERYDVERFLLSMRLFNTVESPGSIYEMSFKDPEPYRGELVDYIAYCLNPNHFHILLKQKVDNGISILMNRLGGYTTYYNLRHKRKGTLFQGRFKAKSVDDNDYLLHLSAYVNLNARVHQLGALGAKLSQSSYGEYLNAPGSPKAGICVTDIILDQFKNSKEYEKFCEESLELMLSQKEEARELKNLAIDDL